MSEAEMIDFRWSSQILLRHGFEIDTGRESPVRPAIEDTHFVMVGDGDRNATEILPRRVPTRRRVSWNVSPPRAEDFLHFHSLR
jgi:hypothetical protein